MKKIIKEIAFLVIIVFAIFGVIIFTVIVHELSHQLDYQKVHPMNESICGFVISPNLINGDIGFYSFNYHSKYTDEVERINDYTEKKAYTITTIMLIFFIISFHIVLDEKIKNG